jgi:hypothetical protein
VHAEVELNLSALNSIAIDLPIAVNEPQYRNSSSTSAAAPTSDLVVTLRRLVI